MANDFFGSLGKAVAQELSAPTGRYGNNPAQRAHLSDILNSTLQRHIAGPGARDAAMPTGRSFRAARDQEFGDPNMEPSGNGGPSEPINASDAIQFIRMILVRLPPNEKDQFMAALGDLLGSEDGISSGAPANNTGATDRNRRGARDNQMPRPGMDARLAVRQLATSSFDKRWGHLTSGVETWGRR